MTLLGPGFHFFLAREPVGRKLFAGSFLRQEDRVRFDSFCFARSARGVKPRAPPRFDAAKRCRRPETTRSANPSSRSAARSLRYSPRRTVPGSCRDRGHPTTGMGNRSRRLCCRHRCQSLSRPESCRSVCYVRLRSCIGFKHSILACSSEMPFGTTGLWTSHDEAARPSQKGNKSCNLQLRHLSQIGPSGGC